MASLDQIELQRLVDGELNLEQTRRLLEIAESNPDAWRLIASSFVENQIWQKEFEFEESFGGDACVKKPTSPRSFSGSPFVKWLSLAATIMLAASVGFLFQDLGSQVDSVGSGLAGNRAATSPPSNAASLDNAIVQQAVASDLNQTPAMYQFQLQDPTGNTFVDSQVPLYSTQLKDARKLLGETEIPASMRRRLAESGYDMIQDVRFLKGKLNDGRNFLIPVRNYRFSPGQ